MTKFLKAVAKDRKFEGYNYGIKEMQFNGICNNSKWHVFKINFKKYNVMDYNRFELRPLFYKGLLTYF